MKEHFWDNSHYIAVSAARSQIKYIHAYCARKQTDSAWDELIHWDTFQPQLGGGFTVLRQTGM